MTPLLERIASGDILLADGAMGSLLFDRGLKIGQCPEEINLSHPQWLKEIAAAYRDAGADIIQTNSFGGSPLKLAQYNLDNQTEEINRFAAELVREVVGSERLVSGSVGPSGKILTPYGDTEPEELLEGFKRQIEALIRGTVDLICIETMTDINEAVLALDAARSVSESVPVIVTMTFDPTARGYFTIMGVDIPTAVKKLQEAGANIIGSNCGNGIEEMVEIARQFVAESDRPVIIQSNAGLPELVDNKVTYNESPEYMGQKVLELVELGVSIIGGCCGTRPEHIAAFRKAIDNHLSISNH